MSMDEAVSVGSLAVTVATLIGGLARIYTLSTKPEPFVMPQRLTPDPISYDYTPRLSRPRPRLAPDVWDEIVGIDLDDWMRADSGEQIRWLAWLRDHPMPQQGARPRPPRRECDNCVTVANWGSWAIATVCGGLACAEGTT